MSLTFRGRCWLMPTLGHSQLNGVTPELRDAIVADLMSTADALFPPPLGES